MTLHIFNGFEGYADPYDQESAGDFINSIQYSNMIYGTGRNGGNSLKYNNYSVNDNRVLFNQPSIASGNTGIVGFAFKINGGVSSDRDIFKFGYNSQVYDGVYLEYLQGGNIMFHDLNYTSNIGTYVFTPIKGTWYYLEIKRKTNDTTGFTEFRINEQVVYTFNGDNKSLFTDGTLNYLSFIFAFNSYMEIDDFYFADDQGSDINDYLGDVRIDAIHPNGAGNYAQMTPSAGNNYECVDEVEMDDSDYVYSAIDGQKDSYTFGNVPTDLDDAAIMAIQIKINAKRTAAADNRKIIPFIRTGSTDYSQTEKSLLDNFGMVNGDMVLSDPSDSNPWTQAKINACEFGMEVGT